LEGWRGEGADRRGLQRARWEHGREGAVGRRWCWMSNKQAGKRCREEVRGRKVELL